MKGFSKSHVGRGLIRSYAEPFSRHNYAYGRHASKVGMKKTTKNHKNIFIFYVPSNYELCKTTSGIGFVEPKTTMVGERIRREPSGELESWKEKEMVWHKLGKGKITRFMEKLHGFNAGVTKIMVETWSNGRVKIDGVTHQIFEGLHGKLASTS